MLDSGTQSFFAKNLLEILSDLSQFQSLGCGSHFFKDTDQNFLLNELYGNFLLKTYPSEIL